MYDQRFSAGASNKTPQKIPQEPQRQPTFFQHTVNIWVGLSSPAAQRFGSSIEEKELFRRSRLLSAIFFLFIVAILLTIPTAIAVPMYWRPILALFLLGLISCILNRQRNVTASGIVCILAIEATLVILLTTLPQGLRNSNIPDFDFFILPVLIAGILLPRQFLPFLAAAHIVMIVAIFSLVPHDPLLTREILVNQHGLAYAELSDAITIQIVATTIAWLSARSVERALARASRAEELAEVRERLNQQARQSIEQKQRLEYGITILKDAQARFSNGDYKARAKLYENELVPLAASFNLMAERLARVVHVERDYQRLERAVEHLLEVQDSLSQGEEGKPFHPTGTLLDRIYPLFNRYRQLHNFVTQSSEPVEQVRAHLSQQRKLLSQLGMTLSQTYSREKLYIDTTRQSHRTFEGNFQTTGKFPMNQARDDLSSLITHFDSLLENIEAAQQLCAQINELNRQSSLHIKTLSQRLVGVRA